MRRSASSQPRATQMEGVSCSQPTSTVASSAWVGRTWPTRKRKTNYSETMWPKRVKEEEANVISAQREGLWASVESVTISGKQLEYREQKDCEYNLILCNSLFEITSAQGTATLACKPLREELFLKAKFLYEEVLAFSNMEKATDYTLRTYARKAHLQSQTQKVKTSRSPLSSLRQSWLL